MTTGTEHGQTSAQSTQQRVNSVGMAKVEAPQGNDEGKFCTSASVFGTQFPVVGPRDLQLLVLTSDTRLKQGLVSVPGIVVWHDDKHCAGRIVLGHGLSTRPGERNALSLACCGTV